VHGLHEYKGKFNPQIAKAILNIFGVGPGSHVLDPFCGSGTTLVECAHAGAIGYGVDMNPLAVFIANAKLQALATPCDEFQKILAKLKSALASTKIRRVRASDDARTRYLESWFEPGILNAIENVRSIILEEAGSLTQIFLAIASNLLRDYSLQDPHDLRIRRRKSPLPTIPFAEVLLANCEQVLERLRATQDVVGSPTKPGKAMLSDTTALTSRDFPTPIDAVVTSPPYAMALPYIDTQRLSLVWLKLISPSEILELEARLIGSREVRGGIRKRLGDELRRNDANLPDAEATICVQLHDALAHTDGFRRQAVPSLLYRYFSEMLRSFHVLRSVLRPACPFALVVGHNHTVLGGVRYDINTPKHLASIASHAGWRIDELIELQTYQRYGYHMSNAVAAETLVILHNC
jgi:site-specific DNA-methyltransferase (cytosine-N4-specific)